MLLFFESLSLLPELFHYFFFFLLISIEFTASGVKWSQVKIVLEFTNFRVRPWSDWVKLLRCGNSRYAISSERSIDFDGIGCSLDFFDVLFGLIFSHSLFQLSGQWAQFGYIIWRIIDLRLALMSVGFNCEQLWLFGGLYTRTFVSLSGSQCFFIRLRIL
jgi:hypothetical protein